MLSTPARDSLSIDNAGGQSNISEAVSIDMMNVLHANSDFCFENQVDYIFNSSMLDYTCQKGNARVGVSVTRAVGRFDMYNDCFVADTFTHIQADRLITKKLQNLLIAKNSVILPLQVAVLHVFCQNSTIADLCQAAFYRQDHLISQFGNDPHCHLTLYLTVCDNTMVYSNNRPKYDYDRRPKPKKPKRRGQTL